MTRSVAALAYLLLVHWPVAAATDPFVGNFVGELDGETFELSIDGSGAQYEGYISVGGDTISLVGRRFGEQLSGQLGIGGDSFGFNARLEGTVLLFQDENGVRIRFLRDHDASVGSAERSDELFVSGEREVFVNRIRVDTEVLQDLEARDRLPIADGRYWYDADTGAWGVEGGPTAGLVLPGLPLPGPMPDDISGGGTGSFINGREIHPLDQQALHQLFGVTYRGEFWMDDQGNIGYFGGPAIANVLQASRAAQAAAAGGSVTQGYSSAGGARGTLGGGMYSGRSATGKSVFWYPGM
jgi:hypothetical protein